MLQMPNWLSQYLNGSHLHDEVEHHCGGDTHHWDDLFAKLSNLNENDIHLRTNEIKRLLQDSGVTQSPKGSDWRLDPLPLMLSESDWQTIRSGVIQRVQLLNQIADDLYGERTLIQQGIIPAAHLHASDEYIRECFSLNNQSVKVTLAAVDLYRDRSGQFKVLADHLQHPQGLGLLLENRVIARRVMGDEFSECNVQRIADFFNKFQTCINDAVPGMRDPRVVILSKGPQDAYYSEQAFLATYMGYTLVHSADLTVRKGDVWLKSLKGLRKVDVIVRWLPDAQLDSLEQTDYSIDGIPGLLQACRKQTVHLVNPVGCGVLECPSVKSNIQKIAQQLLNEPLILQEPECFAATTVQAQALLQDPSGYHLYSYADSQFCLDGDSEAQEIKKRLSTNNHMYYFRQKADFSTAPFWDNHQLVAQPISIRCFALFSPQGVEVLPSALCFAHNGELTEQWIKDTWVISNQPQPVHPTATKVVPEMSDLALLDGDIPSRTAENLYWLGRYLERGENTVRMLRLLIDRYTEFSVYPDSNNKKIVMRLVEAAVNQAIIFPYKAYQFSDNPMMSYIPREITANILSDKKQSGSLINILKALVNSALQIRDLLSQDSWRIIDDMRDEIRRIERSPASLSTRVMQTTADRIISSLMAFNGSISDSMANNNGWFMLDIGRRVERSTQLIKVTQTLLCEVLSDTEQLNMLESVLTSQVSLITHKRRYRMYQSIESGVELLLLDAHYPRSLLYQIEQLDILSQQLPEKSSLGKLGAQHKILLQMRTLCHLADSRALVEESDGNRLQLQSLMQDIHQLMERYSEALMVQYFSHTKAAVSLTANTGSIAPSEV